MKLDWEKRGARMLELRDNTCFPRGIVIVYATLACVDAAIAVIAFCQVLIVLNFY